MFFFCVQMNLLDRAIKLAAEQDEPVEMNFVRKHALQQVGGRMSAGWVMPTQVGQRWVDH